MKENNNVNINFSFKNMESSDPLRDYAREKVENCTAKFIDHQTEVDLIFKKEGKRNIAEVTFNYNGTNFTDVEETEDMYKSVDNLIDSLSAQLRKYKEKATSHH